MNLTPDQIKSMNWRELRERVSPAMWRVYAALQDGPATTWELHDRMGSAMSILTVRPRVTELFQLGLAELVAKRGGEGVYRAVSLAQAEQRHARHAEKEEQLLLI